MGSIQEHFIVKLIVDYKKELYFPNGIEKYPTVSDFTLFAYDDRQPYFRLEGKVFKNLNFMLIDPYLVIDDYKPIIDDLYLEQISLKNINDGLILSIVNRKNRPRQELSVNLISPLLINWKEGTANQINLQNGNEYSKDFPLNFSDLKLSCHSMNNFS